MRRNSRFAPLVLSLSMLALPPSVAGQQQGNTEDARTAQERAEQETRQRDPESARTAKEREGTAEAKQKRDRESARTAREREGARAPASPRPPAPPRRSVVVRGHVFVGGYFYDPFFGPYPWWARSAYPYWYFPVYDNSAELRMLVTPKEAAVYVDGFYAGIVNDFDGLFQPLRLPSGGHQVALYLDGYRTAQHNLYLRPGSTLKLHHTMERLPAGVTSERPAVAPAVPPPPAGSYRSPRRPPPVAAPPPQFPEEGPYAVGFGTLDLRVQPAGAEVTIDGERWVSSDEGSFVVQLPIGQHRVEAFHAGYRRFSMEVDVREGETTPLNVSLLTVRQP